MKKLNKFQQKFLVNIISGGHKDVKYFYDPNNLHDYDGLYSEELNADIEINTASEIIERVFFHELFHMWFHLRMDDYYRKKILQSLEKDGISYNDTDQEEVLAVHFAAWMCRKMLNINYDTSEYDYYLVETSMPKKVNKLFNKILKEVQYLLT